MAVSILDPVTALMVIDLQSGSTVADFARPLDAGGLVSAFRGRGLSVVLARCHPARAPVGCAGLGGRVQELPSGLTVVAPAIGPREDHIALVEGGWRVTAS